MEKKEFVLEILRRISQLIKSRDFSEFEEWRRISYNTVKLEQGTVLVNGEIEKSQVLWDLLDNLNDENFEPDSFPICWEIKEVVTLPSGEKLYRDFSTLTGFCHLLSDRTMGMEELKHKVISSEVYISECFNWKFVRGLSFRFSGFGSDEYELIPDEDLGTYFHEEDVKFILEQIHS